MPNNWYVITGGPSSGKTTLLAELEKLGHKTIPEAARTWIDQELAKGLTLEQIRADEAKFQDDVLQLKLDIEKVLNTDVLTFFDRGMHDSLAYLRHYESALSDKLHTAVEDSTYRKVFLLEQLPAYEKDYARIEDADFPAQITQQLKKAYAEYAMSPVWVPVMPIKERLQFVLNQLDT